MEKDRDEVIHKLIDIQYTGMRWISSEVRSGCAEMCWRVFPAYSGSDAYRIEFFGDEVDRITEIDALTGEIKAQLEHVAIFPASHYVVPKEQMKRATENILAGNEGAGTLTLRVRISFWRHRGSRSGRTLMWR